MTHGSRIGWVQVCVAGVLWGTGGLVVAVLHERDGLAAMTASAWRMLIAAVALVAVAAALGRLRSLVEVMRRHGRVVATVGFLTAAYQGLYFVSVLLAGVSVATVVSLGLAPILATAWEHGRTRTWPSVERAGVLGLALVGLVLIGASGSDTAPSEHRTAGIVLAVGAGAAYASTALLGRHVVLKVDPLAVTTGATASGAVSLVPFLLLAELQDDPVLPTDVGSLVLLLYLGVATLALAYGLLYAGLRTVSGSGATVASLIEPVAAATLAVALLDERLPWYAWLGGASILLAVARLGAAPAPRPAD